MKLYKIAALVYYDMLVFKNSRWKIAALTGESAHLISYVAYRKGIRIPRSKHRTGLPFRPEVDKLLTGEYSLRKIFNN